MILEESFLVNICEESYDINRAVYEAELAAFDVYEEAEGDQVYLEHSLFILKEEAEKSIFGKIKDFIMKVINKVIEAAKRFGAYLKHLVSSDKKLIEDALHSNGQVTVNTYKDFPKCVKSLNSVDHALFKFYKDRVDTNPMHERWVTFTVEGLEFKEFAKEAEVSEKIKNFVIGEEKVEQKLSRSSLANDFKMLLNDGIKREEKIIVVRRCKEVLDDAEREPDEHVANAIKTWVNYVKFFVAANNTIIKCYATMIAECRKALRNTTDMKKEEENK